MFQILLTVSEVGELLFEFKIKVNLSFCVVWCDMLSTSFYRVVGMILTGNASVCQWHLPWIQWDFFFGNSEMESETFVSLVFHIRSHRCHPWSTSMLLSLWPGASWSFEGELFRDKHQPMQKFHWRWGSEGLLSSGIPSGCSWCLCRQYVERFCNRMG